jgi:hypothetical protein
MSIQEVTTAARNVLMEDPYAETLGYCRRASKFVLDAIRNADITEPRAEKYYYYAWSSQTIRTNIHYATGIKYRGREPHVVNINKIAGCPLYIGSLSEASGLPPIMVECDEII